MDYKVNFKTKTMEWKTKYNNLVDDFKNFKENILKPQLVASGLSVLTQYNEYVNFAFDVDDLGENINGLYLFTYGNCMVLIPIYNLVEDIEYKIAMAFRKSDNGVNNSVLTYMIKNNTLLLFEKTNNIIPLGYTGYLFKIPLN